MSEELQSLLEAVDSILQQCALHEGIQDIDFNSLQNCIAVLQHIANNGATTRNGHLEELLFLICRVLQQWEHKLFNLEVSSLPKPTSEALTRELQRTDGRGRPFVAINPDQVDFLISGWSHYGGKCSNFAYR